MKRMRRFILALTQVLLLIGCSPKANTKALELLEYVQKDTEVNQTIVDWAYQETGILFEIERIDYPQSKTLQTDRLHIELVTIQEPSLRTHARIDIKDDKARNDILEGNVTSYLRFEREIDITNPVIDLIEAAYIKSYETLYQDIIDDSNTITRHQSKPFISASFQGGLLSDPQIQSLKDLYNKSGFTAFLESDKNDYLDFIKGSWLVKEDHVVGGQTIKKASFVLIQIVASSDTTELHDLRNQIEAWFEKHESELPQGLEHRIVVFDKKDDTKERVRYTVKVQEGLITIQ